MEETLMQRRRVSDEGLRVVKLCSQGKRQVIVPEEKGPANFVPAAAVRRGVQALFGIIGRKAGVGGSISQE